MNSTANYATTQRRLILVRHAHAVEDDIGGDHARSLSARGQAEAQALGAWLTEQALLPEQVLCSTATRTRQTLAGLGHTIPTLFSDRLYMATAAELLAQVHATENRIHTLMLLCHNPGVHSLLTLLAGDFAQEADAERLLLKFPPAGCAVLDVTANTWREVTQGSARLALLKF